MDTRGLEQHQPSILRVRRRRRRLDDTQVVNALRIAPQLDTLFDNWHTAVGQAEDDEEEEDQNVEDKTSSTSLVAYYERIESSSLLTVYHDNKKRRKEDIVDAHFLEEDERITTTTTTTTHPSKRRKLLQIIHHDDDHNPAGLRNIVVRYPILTPAQNKVNDSLLMVFQGQRSLMEHISFLQTTFHEDDWKIWLHWCCCPGGTILHAAALWDDQPSMTRLQSSILLHHYPQEEDTNTFALVDILHILNEEGHSALDIARLACNETMIVYLEQLESQSEFVYDYYEFRPERIDTSTANDNNDPSVSILDCELLRHNAVYHRSGPAVMDDSDLMLEFTANPDSEDTNDDEEDSNQEDFFTNDWPDEESSSDDDDINFRNYYEDEDGEFDPAYCGVYGQR